jgi:hypothetical protein
MADGGIAGYEDDEEGMATGGMGGMFNFAQQSEPVVRMSGGGEVPRYNERGLIKYEGAYGGKNLLPDTSGYEGMGIGEFISQFGADAWEKYKKIMSSDAEQARNKKATQVALEKSVAKSKQEVAGQFDQRPAMANDPRLEGVNLAAPVVPAAAAAAAASAVPASPQVPGEKPAASGAPRPQGAQGTQGGASGQGIQSMYELFAGPKNVRDTELNEIQQRVREQGEAETSAAQRQLDQLKTDLAAQGSYGKDREAKLKAKEERIGKEEGQSGGLALLEAGLAMMSGTSANAFANIGQGAMAGTAAYRKSQERLNDARDKLDDAYGRLEDVRFNQQNMNKAELRKATADVDKAANAGLKSLTDFAITRYGLNDATAKTMFTGAIQERVANIGAGATLGAAKMRSQDNKDYLQTIKGSGAIEQARKNVMEQVMKANKYGTPEDLQTAFEAEWKKTLQLNPELAKLAGTSGGGSAVDTTGFKVIR